MSDKIIPSVLGEESPDFQAGAIEGRKASAEDLTAGSIEGIDPEKHSQDWYAGWLYGYRTYLEEYYDGV